ncbi:MAG: DUF1232 domain-containing protein [Planctomycetes bacterium]|nr:DUF1232 domain-containing protein [Planctomycetota bacterium]
MNVRDYSKIFGQDVTPEDVDKAIAAFWKKMQKVLGVVPFGRQAVGLYYMIRDPKVALGVKATAVLALLYFISPVDAIPDVIPITGYLDDAAVITSALTVLGPMMKPFLALADKWIDRGRPLKDDREEPEVVIAVDVKQHAANP